MDENSDLRRMKTAARNVKHGYSFGGNKCFEVDLKMGPKSVSVGEEWNVM